MKIFINSLKSLFSLTLSLFLGYLLRYRFCISIFCSFICDFYTIAMTLTKETVRKIISFLLELSDDDRDLCLQMWNNLRFQYEGQSVTMTPFEFAVVHNDFEGASRLFCAETNFRPNSFLIKNCNLLYKAIFLEEGATDRTATTSSRIIETLASKPHCWAILFEVSKQVLKERLWNDMAKYLLCEATKTCAKSDVDGKTVWHLLAGTTAYPEDVLIKSLEVSVGHFGANRSDRDADLDFMNIKDSHGNTPLHIACSSYNMRFLRTVLSHCDISADGGLKNNAGKTALDLLADKLWSFCGLHYSGDVSIEAHPDYMEIESMISQ